jgi:hypothetical protein
VLSTIKASDITKYYKAGTQYTATFLDSQGIPQANRNVNITLNGKTYSKKTNSKGVVSMPVNLNPGTYKIKSTDPLTGYKLTTTFRILETITSSDVQKFIGVGKKFTAKFPGLAPDQTYTCRPGYAYSGKDRPSIWDKPITFSATTPSISIVDLKMTKNTREVMYDENIQPTGMIYSYSFDTYSEVKGSRNVSEWGIIDLNDQNAKTRVHTSKSSTLKSGQYIHHWSIKNTRLSKIKISLQPYVFAKDGNKSDWSEAKFFPVYHATIQDEFDFTDDSRLMRPVPADYGHQFEPTVLQLDSVTCDGMRVM